MTGISPLIRSATLFGYADQADALGLDTDHLLAQVGLSRAILQDPDHPVAVDRVRALLETSARRSGVESFGLRLGERRRLSHLGMIGLVIREEATGMAALKTLSRYMRLVVPSLSIFIEEFADLTVIREELVFARSTRIRQSIEMALSVMTGILRELLGSDWNAQSVHLVHRAPMDISQHRSSFRCPLHFNAEFNGLVCASSDLQRQLPDRNALLARMVQTSLDKRLAGTVKSDSAAVRQLIVTLLPLGRCSASQVAGHLRISPRTLHRYLAREGHSFSSLLQQTRQDLVAQQLRDSDRSITEIAQLLSFDSLSAFGHWFQGVFGTNAGEWRRLQVNQGDD